eukprot:scaffold259460_cov30-Tisochrysis_lutea.AAC.3
MRLDPLHLRDAKPNYRPGKFYKSWVDWARWKWQEGRPSWEEMIGCALQHRTRGAHPQRHA